MKIVPQKSKFYMMAEGYIMERENQLQRFNEDIENLKAKSETVTIQPKPLSSEQIQRLRRKYEIAQARLQKLKTTKKESSWEALKQDVEEAWDDLTNALKNAVK